MVSGTLKERDASVEAIFFATFRDFCGKFWNPVGGEVESLVGHDENLPSSKLTYPPKMAF